MRVRTNTMTLRAPRCDGTGVASVRSLRRVLRREAAYAIIRPALFAGEVLPRRCAALLYETASLVLYALLPRLRSRSARNVRAALGGAAAGAEANRVVRAAFRSWARCAADLPRLRTISAADLERLVRLDGLDRLTAALASGRGVVATAPHLGNWEVLACALAARGIPISVVAADLYDPRLSRYLVPARERWGVRTILKGRPDTARRMMSVLRRGEVLGILGDLRTRDESVVAPFLGRPSRFAAGPVRLALRAGSPIVPMGIARAAGSTYAAQILPALDVAGPGTDGTERLESGVRRVAAALSEMILKCPEQWLWMHDRWPEGEGA